MANPSVDEYFSQIADQGGGSAEDYGVASKPAATTSTVSPDDSQPLQVIASVTGLARLTHKIKISLPPAAGNIFYNDPSNQLLLPLKNTAGFLFPIQPAITTGFDAKYQEIVPTHSNFPYQMYQSSSMKPISLTGDFIIRNQYDAQYVNAGIHFLRSLTRMFNARDGVYAGAPPQVVRLHGLGFTAFDNIPCVLTDLTVTFPDSVDYITFQINKSSSVFGPETARIPVNLSIQVSLAPVFSRDFITNTYSTTGFSSGAVRLLGPNEDKQKSKSADDSAGSVNGSTDASVPSNSAKPNTNAVSVESRKQILSNAVKGITKASDLLNKGKETLSKITSSPSTGLAKLTSKLPGVLPNVGSAIGTTALNAVTNKALDKLINTPGQQSGVAKVLGQGVKVVGKFM
jgi:hypothetical protein